MNKLFGFVIVFVLASALVPGVYTQDIDGFNHCFYFENLPFKYYYVGDSFTVQDAKVTAYEFVLSNGTTYGGDAFPLHRNNLAGGWGYEIATRRVNLLFEFTRPFNGLVLRYGKTNTGSFNLAINGEFVNLDDLLDLNRSGSIGSVDVVVEEIDDTHGFMRFKGTIETLMIGGENLSIDDGCENLSPDEFPDEGCITFDLFPSGMRFFTGDVFFDTSVMMEGQEFLDATGNLIANGMMKIDNQGLAGGQGNDLQVENIDTRFTFLRPAEQIHLLFGALGGNLNFGINGELASFRDISEINETDVGGSFVNVGVSGNGQGEIVVEGKINTMTIGGEELWIDEICWSAPG